MPETTSTPLDVRAARPGSLFVIYMHYRRDFEFIIPAINRDFAAEAANRFAADNVLPAPHEAHINSAHIRTSLLDRPVAFRMETHRPQYAEFPGWEMFAGAAQPVQDF